MTAHPQVIELVERFARNLDAYKRAEYKEAHVRVEFIDPFFRGAGLGCAQRAVLRREDRALRNMGGCWP